MQIIKDFTFISQLISAVKLKIYIINISIFLNR